MVLHPVYERGKSYSRAQKRQTLKVHLDIAASEVARLLQEESVVAQVTHKRQYVSLVVVSLYFLQTNHIA